MVRYVIGILASVQAIIPGGGGGGGFGHVVRPLNRVDRVYYSASCRMCFWNGKLQKIFCCCTGILYANN